MLEVRVKVFCDGCDCVFEDFATGDIPKVIREALAQHHGWKNMGEKDYCSSCVRDIQKIPLLLRTKN